MVKKDQEIKARAKNENTIKKENKEAAKIEAMQHTKKGVTVQHLKEGATTIRAAEDGESFESTFKREA